MSRRMTHDEFVTKFENKNPQKDSIIFLSKYEKGDIKIKCKCLKDGHVWDVMPRSLLSGIGCPKCGGSVGRTTDEFIEELNHINPDILVLGDYAGVHTKIKCKCKLDGHEWYPIPKNLLKGVGCPMCQRKLLSEIHFISHEKFVNMAREKNPKIQIISKYTGMNSRIKVKCLCHDYEYMAYPSNIIKGCGCKFCRSDIVSYKRRKTHEQFESQLTEKYGDKVKVLGRYIDDKTKLQFKHSCGFIFESAPSNILRYLACPNCMPKSCGEEIIKEYLDNKSIIYFSQHKFDDLRGMFRQLSYDFFIPDKNILIEYQGEQHERPVEFFGGEGQFIIQQEYDRRKREYANSHDMKLLEIWYWDYNNITEILDQELALASSF